MTDRDIQSMSAEEIIADLNETDADGSDEADDLDLEIDADLPLDKGFEIAIRPVDGDRWSRSHTHTLGEIFVLHLTPGDAQEFDRYLNQYLMENL